MSASMQVIADELNISNFSMNDVPKKIKSLRSTYYLELAKVEKSKASGGGTNFVYKPLVSWCNDRYGLYYKNSNRTRNRNKQ